MDLAGLKDVDPDAMIISMISWQHLLILKTADDFPINAFVHFEMPLSYYNYHWNAVSEFRLALLVLLFRGRHNFKIDHRTRNLLLSRKSASTCANANL